MVDWFSVLTDYGIDVPNTNQFIIHCPFHEDRRQSCSINLDKGVWICFALVCIGLPCHSIDVFTEKNHIITGLHV